MQTSRVALLSAAALAAAPGARAANPVSKVTDLLKGMLSSMEKEQEDDEKTYDKMACWCETNDREKNKSILEAEAHIEALTTQIEELTQLSAQLGTEIANTKQEVASNQQGLDKATAIRQKELAEFNAHEKEMIETISALKNAIAVLSKHHSLLQVPAGGILMDTSAMDTVTATLRRVFQTHSSLLDGALTGSERKAAMAFVQRSGAPQSGEIFGIMQQMKETFDSDLAAAQKEEADSIKAYEELKAAKESEIAAGQDQVNTKTQEKADADEKNANAKLDLDNTKHALSADEQFLMDLKEKCATADKEWDTRQKTRQLEMEACSKALAVLSSDDSHNLFTTTLSFAQQSETTQSKGRQEASKLLSGVASKLHSPRLAALAMRVKLDAFTRVKKAIDDMVATLLKEKQDEIKQKDFCIEEFHTNEKQQTDKTREHQDLLAKIEDLQQTIKELTDRLDTLHSEMDEMRAQLKRAGEDREKANAEFQGVIANQRETQQVLKKAMAFLQDFYEKNKNAFVQANQPAQMEKYERKDGVGVIGMIQSIVDDAKSLETETIRDEEDAQKFYEDFVKETNTGLEARKAEVVEKSDEKATAEVDLVEAKEGRDNAMLELEQLANYNGQLHKSCDYVLKNFEVRQTARDEEVQALRTAKDILSGAKFVQYLQR